MDLNYCEWESAGRERRDWLKEKKLGDSKYISGSGGENNAIGVCMWGAMQPITKIIGDAQWPLLNVEFIEINNIFQIIVSL